MSVEYFLGIVYCEVNYGHFIISLLIIKCNLIKCNLINNKQLQADEEVPKSPQSTTKKSSSIRRREDQPVASA